MELRGKTINILGDSITYGLGTGDINFCYPNVFAELTGAKINNYGVSGTRLAKRIVPHETKEFDVDFQIRMQEMDEKADAVVVFGGTNDYGHGDAPMGDMDSRDPYTFYGACHIIMDYLSEHYCGKPIVFMTPLHRAGENEKNELGHILKEYVDIIREVAEFYSIAVLDLYKMSGITPNVPKGREALMPDGLHPSRAGARIIAERLKGFMEAL